jgi:hypothetical protein
MLLHAALEQLKTENNEKQEIDDFLGQSLSFEEQLRI